MTGEGETGGEGAEDEGARLHPPEGGLEDGLLLQPLRLEPGLEGFRTGGPLSSTATHQCGSELHGYDAELQCFLVRPKRWRPFPPAASCAWELATEPAGSGSKRCPPPLSCPLPVCQPIYCGGAGPEVVEVAWAEFLDGRLGRGDILAPKNGNKKKIWQATQQQG